jgi:HK97 family phage major capsid protein
MPKNILDQLRALDDLNAKRKRVAEEIKSLTDKMQDGDHSPGLKTRIGNLTVALGRLEEQIDQARQVDGATDDGRGEPGSEPDSNGHKAAHKAARLPGEGASIADGARAWATATAAKMRETAAKYGVKALTSGQIDAPQMVRTGTFPLPTNPARLLDLLVNRMQVPGNEFEFLRQTTRTDNAAAVADSATKPTSVYTLTSIQDRARVYAHLSEPVPLRLFQDHAGLESFLSMEMSRGVLDALETDVVSGAAASENVVGILNTVGIGSTAFDTNAVTSLRKAYTAMQNLHEDPTAWVLNPDDAEALDLLQTADGEFIVDSSAYANIFKGLPPVVSTSVPAGTALLADWRLCTLYVRQDTTVDADMSGTLFDTNQAKMRAEGRFGFAVNRPQAFREVALTA